MIPNTSLSWLRYDHLLYRWLLMISATDVLGLCASRIFVGVGAGFGIAKFKTYWKEIWDLHENSPLQKYLPLFICFGITVTFTAGSIVNFQMLSIILSVVPGITLLIFIFVPDTPYNLFKKKKFTNAVEVLQNMHGKQNVDDKIENIKNMIERTEENESIFQVLKNKQTRKSFIKLTFLITIQQFTGSPSLIVYSQIVYKEFNCPLPGICAIIYSVAFLISTGIGIKYTPSFPRKPTILISLAVIIFISSSHAAYLYYKLENQIYSTIPFIMMILYVAFHTAGISSVTSLVAIDIFPMSSRYTISCFSIMYTSQLAVIVTKIFQVLYARYGMYVGFSLYASVGLFGFVVTLIFLRETKGELERNRET